MPCNMDARRHHLDICGSGRCPGFFSLLSCHRGSRLRAGAKGTFPLPPADQPQSCSTGSVQVFAAEICFSIHIWCMPPRLSVAAHRQACNRRVEPPPDHADCSRVIAFGFLLVGPRERQPTTNHLSVLEVRPRTCAGRLGGQPAWPRRSPHRGDWNPVSRSCRRADDGAAKNVSYSGRPSRVSPIDRTGVNPVSTPAEPADRGNDPHHHADH